MGENKEKIETCSIDQKADALESRCNESLRIREEEYEIISSLRDLGRHNLEIVKKGNFYFFKVENQDIVLPIAFQLKELPEKLSLINNILDLSQQEKLKLTGDIHGRMITEEKSIFQMLVSIANGESPHNILLETTGEKYKKDEAETIFKFAMNAKGTDLQNWKIEGEVCKTNNTQLCAENMGNDFIDNQGTEIIAGLKETNSDYIVFKNPNTIEQAIATTD